MLQFDFAPKKPEVIKCDHRPYYIASGEWMQTSMGYRAPFLLCHTLNELGYEAYVTAQKQAPNLWTPLLTAEIMAEHRANEREIIAVYNEGVWGNALQGNVVVRWIMNRLGKMVDRLPESNDLFYFWCENYSLTPETSKYLRMPAVDISLFNRDGIDDSKREGYAYYAHKYIRDGNGKINKMVKSGGISLCQDIPRSHREIADILRSIKVLYTYEETALAEEAAMCGCPVVLVMNPYIGNLIGERDIYDYAISEEELDVYAEWSFSEKLLNQTLESNNECEVLINEFITETQNARINTSQFDEFLEFVGKHDKIMIYGTGITSTMVYNLLNVVGANICGFITSDEYYLIENDKRYGLPIIPVSKLNKELTENSGVVLAMMRNNAMQVIDNLEQKNIHYYNPVLL